MSNDNKVVEFLDGFTKTCSEQWGFTNVDDMFEILKEAMEVSNEQVDDVQEQDKEYKRLGKLINPPPRKKERDCHGLSGDPSRTNVGTTAQYAI